MPHALTAPRRRPHRWPHRTLKQTLQDLDDGWAIKNKKKRKAFMQLKGLRYNKWSRSVSSDHVPRAVPNQGLLIIGERCVRSFGYCGEKVAFAERPLTASRSSHRVGYEVVLDQTRLILTKR